MRNCVCEKLQHPGIPCGDARCICHDDDGFVSSVPVRYGTRGRIIMANMSVKQDIFTLEFKDKEAVAAIREISLTNMLREFTLFAIPKTIIKE